MGSKRHVGPLAGFTLVEMLIVIIIVGITAAIALPRINLSGIRSKSSVQSLGTTMLALQREAIARQHNVVVVIDATRRQLRVVDDSTNNEQITAGERIRTVSLGEGVVFGKPAAVTARPFGGNAINFISTEASTALPDIVFYRNGSAKEAGGFYLSTAKAMAGAAGHGDETWAMEISRATGRAEWLRWNGTTWIRGF
jgi:prepilin-type N-terminal cleavage/methylation domain-containing protein